ncbi:carbohydrate kinase family protein [Microlunatus antarcticus]|uniref:Fructokinase n=1 Tax=Microlunatus antarcticus TaxID=53388 RepID=A0A7W5P7X7_9ACTN|nr:carbohydrate kinase [Microlunatus antarcticus]MBB3327877.1 fructokinase [Microlunatus antarcticus]
MSAPDIVVAGDAFVDLTSTVAVDGGPAYAPHPGGSCLNVAVGLGRLGVPTALLARVSDDGFGELLRRHLAGSDVLDTFLVPSTDQTGLGVADILGGVAGYRFYNAGTADRGLRPEHLDGLALPPGAALHVGSVALAYEPQAGTLTGLVRAESGRRLVTLDPNVRPSVIADRDHYLEQLAGWVALSDVVKVSDEDVAWLHPGEPVEAVARRWLDAGAALVLVTSGADGAWATTGAYEARVATPTVEVVDTVGAGDAFMAATLASLWQTGRLTRAGVASLEPADLQTLLAFAVEVAADTCTRSGAEPPRWAARPLG